MGIVQFPVGRLDGRAERMAFRLGVARLNPGRPSLRVVATAPTVAFCAACASPIDYGAVWRGEEAFCSVECSLGGNRPA
jgi:hypothetical protein